MVNWWDAQIEKGIKLTKMRIKHCEKHGMGDVAMQEKSILKKQERAKILREEKKKK